MPVPSTPRYRCVRRILSAAVVAAFLLGLPLMAATPEAAATTAIPMPTAMHWDKSVTWQACPAPVWPRPTAKQRASLSALPGHGERVLVLGDSLTHNMYKMLEAGMLEQGWPPTIVCWGGKTTAWGEREAMRLSDAHRLPQRVFVALGTNDLMRDHPSPAAFRSSAERLIGTLGNDKLIQWINLQQDNEKTAWYMHGYRDYNQELVRVASEHSNVQIVDWHAAVGDRRATGGRVDTLDGIHYDDATNIFRMAVILKALREADEFPAANQLAGTETELPPDWRVAQPAAAETSASLSNRLIQIAVLGALVVALALVGVGHILRRR